MKGTVTVLMFLMAALAAIVCGQLYANSDFLFGSLSGVFSVAFMLTGYWVVNYENSRV